MNNEIDYDDEDEVIKVDPAIFNGPISDLNLRPVIPIEQDRSLDEAINIMQTHRFGCCVVTSNGKVNGIFTERDVLFKVIGKGLNLKEEKISNYMTNGPLTLRPNDSIGSVMNYMHMGGYRHIPIVNEADKPLYVVSIKSLNSFILDQLPDAIRALRKT